MLVADPRQLTDDLCDRPVGDPVAVGETRAAHRPRARYDLREELLDQPGLPDPRLPTIVSNRHSPSTTREKACSRPSSCPSRPVNWDRARREALASSATSSRR